MPKCILRQLSVCYRVYECDVSFERGQTGMQESFLYKNSFFSSCSHSGLIPLCLMLIKHFAERDNPVVFERYN